MRRRIVIAGLTAGAVLAATAVAVGAPEPADRSVVVLLKDPGAAKGGVLPHRVKDFTLGNAFSADVTAAQQSALAANPAVAAVIPDVRVKLHATSVVQPQVGALGKAGDGKNLCPADPAKPQLEPEALTSIHAQTDVTGSGVKVAYIADGIDPNNADFVRADGSKAIVDVKDFTGRPATTPTEGQEAFGDASSIAAQGLVTHDISTFVNPAHPLPAGCTIRIKGVAPGADVVALDAFDAPNSTTISSVLQAIDYAVSVAHVNVLNESFGLYDFTTTSARDAVELFNDQAVAAGVTVVTASGDGGATNTLNSPGADPKVINVGASTDYRLWAQIGADGYGLGKGGWLDDNVSSLSSTGFSQAGGTIDVTAPGEKNWAACTASALYRGCVDKSGKPAAVLPFGGTSESAPLTSATAALVIQAYRQAHGGQSPTPQQVKQIITGSARDLGVPVQYEGAGLLDAHAAVVLARGAGGILLSTNQISHDGQPGSTRSDQIEVSNPGKKPVVVHAAMQHYVDRGPSAEHDIALDPKTAPTFLSDTGATMAYGTTTFTVDSGTDVLAVNGAWPGPPDVPITVFDPQGRLALNSYPEGAANYANLLVRKPTPGVWTAVAATDKAAAFSGTVSVSVRQQVAAPVGPVEPGDFVLPPGEHRAVTVRSTFPVTTGDSANAVTFTTPFGTTAVADILRSVVPLVGGKGSFTGTITGGNGRAYDPAQSFTYAFDVPAGAPGLNVAVTLARPGDVLTGALIDPNGETPSIGTNHSSLDDPSKIESALSLSAANPLPGRWRFVLAAQNPVAGDLATPFTGAVSLHSGVTVTSDLPATIPAGKAVTAHVTVTNTSPQTIHVQTDARTSTVQDVKLAGRVEPGGAVGPTVQLPMQGFVSPSYLVPPQTSAVTITSTSTVPAQVEISSVGTIGPWGGVDAVGDLKSAQAGNTTSTATVSEQHGYLGQGDWLASLTEIGPFGPAGVPKAQGTLAVTAKTLGFDGTVTSPTGDPYTASTDGSYDGGKPLAIAPGATATIPVTITPNAAAGTIVTGTLNIVSPGDGTELGRVVLEPVPLSGDVLATIPYRYTVG